MEYVKRVGIAVSVLINVLLGGYSNQTLSARNYDLKRRNKFNFVWIIDRAFFFDKDHCLHSWTYWFIRKELEQNGNDLRKF